MKNKVGRPKKKDNELKKTKGIRVSDENLKKIIKIHGSIQGFFDSCVTDLLRRGNNQ